jgi:predicted ATPase
MRLYGVHPRSIPRRTFPPLRTSTARRTNLSERSDPFLGREEEREAVSAAFDGGRRLVTLVGPGGTGKTRLVTELGLSRAELGTHPGGVWFVDLSDAHDAAGVALATARALRSTLPDGVPPQEALRAVGSSIADLGDALILLDNCEQVVSAARDAARTWLKEAPAARMLATSREPLGLRDEHAIELAPLPEDDGVKLFVARARTARPDLELDDADRELLRSLVGRLDGLPLAIELAAARADILSIRAIHDRLSQRFRLLAGSSSDLDERQQTLRKTLDWSWELLDEGERAALAQCSVFRGGFTVEAAEGVLAVDHLPDAPWAMDLVQSLRHKSLLVARTVEGERRLDMLVSVREYAAEKLSGADEAAGPQELQRRHARHYAALAERCGAARHGPSSGDRYLQLFRERENIHAAVAFALDDEPPMAARAVAIGHRLFVLAGGWPELDALFDQVVTIAEGAGDPRLLVLALEGRAYLLRMSARSQAGRADLERALELADGGELSDLEPWLRMALAACIIANREDTWEREFEAAKAGFAARDDAVGCAIADSWMTTIRIGTSVPNAIPNMEHAVRVAESEGGPIEQSMLQVRLARLYFEFGRFDEGHDLYAEAYTWHDRVGSRNDIATVLLQLAFCRTAAGRHEEAEDYVARGLAQARPLGRAAVGVTCALEIWRSANAALRAIAEGAEAADAKARFEKEVASLVGGGDDGGETIAYRSIWVGAAIHFANGFLGTEVEGRFSEG